MSSHVKDLRSLPLYDIIGAPISAMVRAEAEAARTSLEFIEQVGFVKSTDPNVPSDDSALDSGHLRMVEFGYTKPDENGDPANFVARIPLLALFPIPGLRIRLATINFAAKISDVFTSDATTNMSGNTDESPFSEPGVQFRGSLVASSKESEETRASFDMNISVELEQTPVSPGMAKLINLMDQAISDAPAPAPAPAPLTAGDPLLSE